MSKILKISEPIIKNFQRDAFPLSVLAASSDNYISWFVNYFIQIMHSPDFFKTKNAFRVMFYPTYMGYRNPFMLTNKISRQFVNIYDIDLIDAIKKMIENGYYISLALNEFYIPTRNYYQIKDFYHDCLIYGYTDDGFCIVGYNNKMLYAHSSLPYENLVSSFNSMSNDILNYVDDQIYIFRPQEVDYIYNIKLTKHLLSDYVYSKNTSLLVQDEMAYRYKDYVFGIKVQTYLSEYIDAVIRGTTPYDFQVMHFFTEHKNCMSLVLNYLLDNNYVNEAVRPHIQSYKQIEQDFSVYFRLFMKASISGQVKYLRKILEDLPETIKREADILSAVLNGIHDD